MKEYDNFDYMTIRKLDINKDEDKQLVNDYWNKVNETVQMKEDLVLMHYFTQIFKLNVDL